MYNQSVELAPSIDDFIAEFQTEKDAFQNRVQAATLSIRYSVALNVVERIDALLDLRVQHYRNKAGQLLTTLDQVITAILNDDLIIETGEVK
jgi:hypothetical protein